MKITALRIRRATVAVEQPADFWPGRYGRPVDAYPGYAAQAALLTYGVREGGTHLRIGGWFVSVETDEGVTGMAGPYRATAARIAALDIRPIVLGMDPLATEKVWDVVHRLLCRHGRTGESMVALAAVDIALWDLKARWLGQPAWRLLGGPTRETVPCYASTLGYDATDLGAVREQALELQSRGFRAQKWFLRYGPSAGREGMAANEALVRTLRDALGDKDDIMVDASRAFDTSYALEMGRRFEPYGLAWFEEPLMPDTADAPARLREKLRMPLAGGEHDHTRWAFARLIAAGAYDVYQPDPTWCGGISETMKIAALLSAHELPCLPHGDSTPVNIHVSAALSPGRTPWQEYLVKWNETQQAWFEAEQHPVKGEMRIPDAAGVLPGIAGDRVRWEEEI